MRILTISLLTTLFINSSFAADEPQTLKDDHAKLNYSVGYQIGTDFKQQNFDIRPEALLKGMQDSLSGNEAMMTRSEMRQTMAELGKRVADLKKKKREQVGQFQQNQKQFLIQNAKKPGVTQTDSGLQYRIIEASNGQKPKLNDKVMVHYRGKLIDGTEFDSSHKRNKPATFKVNQVIKGWTEALQLMPRGSHWQLVIPAELAYGSRGAGTSIPPNSTLIFDVELISIQ